MLKQSAGIIKSNVHIDTFVQYFKAVNNPQSHIYTPDEDVVNF
jgi:hypothetical protein